MTETSLTISPAPAVSPKPPSNSIFQHMRYVMADNAVTGLSFALFMIIALCALIGPYVVPYDPLASDTAVTLVFVMGGFAGIAAGFFGGWTDRIVSRLADTIMAFPLFVLAMGIVAALGNTVTNIVIATAIINYPLYVRVARAEANVRRDAGFVQAARLCGNSEGRIVLTQILPNVMPIMVVQMSLTMGYAI